MAYVATAVARRKDGWTADELQVGGAADLEEVADQLRDLDPQAEVSLLFVEADDAYLAVMRLDNGEDPRIFGTDAAFPEESRLGAILLGDLAEPATVLDETPAGTEPESSGDTPAPEPEAEPVGDAELLADLGLPAGWLLAICARPGMLPADMTAEIAQVIGCGDEVEELRGA